jgi:hypothetical protein
MKKDEVMKIIKEWKEKHNIRLYTPYKYFKGIETKRMIIRRLNEMKKFRKEQNPTKINYTTDTKKKTKKSKYHSAFETRFKIPSSASLVQKSKISGVPLSILKKVRARGIAAWKTGHRPNTTAPQWGNARVSSFLTLGCTAFSSDADLLHQVNQLKRNAKLTNFFSQKPTCPKSKIIKNKNRSNFPSFLKTI